jgi:hypothetical protein
MNEKEKERLAAVLWERLAMAFNEEAETYDPESYSSILGSIGDVERREVCRPNWWKDLGGEGLIHSQSDNRGMIVGDKVNESFEDYRTITDLTKVTYCEND